MSDFKKVFTLASLGLLMTVFVYPLLHEIGHSLCAIVLGAEIYEIILWPTPSVLCNMGGISSISQILIGAGGMLFPILISMSVPHKNFWMRYCNMVLVGVEFLSLLISLAAILCFEIGRPLKNEDITTMLEIEPSYSSMIVTFILGLLCILLVWTIVTKPLKRLKNYLLQ